jgi:hypothetical protein
MEDSTLLDGTWLFSDVMLLTVPSILVSVLDYKQVYLKSANQTHLVFSIIYYTDHCPQHVTRSAPHLSKKGGRCATITGHSPRDEGKEDICSTTLNGPLASYRHLGSAGTNPREGT